MFAVDCVLCVRLFVCVMFVVSDPPFVLHITFVLCCVCDMFVFVSVVLLFCVVVLPLCVVRVFVCFICVCVLCCLWCVVFCDRVFVLCFVLF